MNLLLYSYIISFIITALYIEFKRDSIMEFFVANGVFADPLIVSVIPILNLIFALSVCYIHIKYFIFLSFYEIRYKIRVWKLMRKGKKIAHALNDFNEYREKITKE